MYTFQIDIGSFTNPVVGGGYIACNPLKEKAKFVKSRHREYKRVVRNEIKGQLVFKGSEYDSLKTLESQNELYVPIKCYYNSELKLTGRLDLLGTWDLNKHFCELEINTEDSYSIIFQNLDLEFDIKGASATTAKTNVRSTIITQESVCTTLAANEMKTQMFGDYADLWVTSSTYSDNCTSPQVRHVYKSSSLRWPANGYELYPTLDLYLKATQTSELVQNPFSEFRKVVDVLNYMLDLIDNTISADEDTISDYFTEDPEMKYLMIADKSDAKRRNATGKAGFEYITVKDFLKIYKYLSNLDWYVESNEFKLDFPRIQTVADLSEYPYHNFEDAELYNNLQVYSYKIEDLINKETWSFEKSTSPDFNEQSLVYDNLYEKTTKYDFPALNCDLEEIATDSDDIGDSGYAIVACEKSGTDYFIINKPGIIFGGELMNGKLATTNIITDHHSQGGRPFATATLNGNDISLKIKGIKKVEYKNVPIYDPELLNFNYAINTEIGMAELESLEIDCSLTRFSKVSCNLLPSLIPVVDTILISSPTTNSMIVQSKIITDNGSDIIERGVVYNTSGNPTTEDLKKIVTGTDFEYITTLQNLQSETQYYVRAYAINAYGTGYGDELTESTERVLQVPELETRSIKDVTTSGMTVRSEVISDQGESITERGVVYNKTGLPTIDDNKIVSSQSTAIYDTILSGLDESTGYYVRAYAINSEGVGYGNQLSEATQGDISTPIVQTVEVTGVTLHTMDVTVNVLSDSGSSISERGVVYNLTGSPTTSDNKIIVSGTLGEFTAELTALSINTPYYVRGYAINSEGVGYGGQILQSTLGTLPSVITREATDIQTLSFVANGELVSDGGSEIRSQGFVYAESPKIPTLSDSKVSMYEQIGVYSLTVDGLEAETLYNFRAYATNDEGTSYGETKQALTDEESVLWTVMVSTPVVTGDETTLETRVTNEVTIQVRYGIYLNGNWIYDTQTATPGTMVFYNFYIQNPLGQPIPSGTNYKVETIYDGSIYTNKTGQL